MASEDDKRTNVSMINASVFKKTQGRNIGLYAVTALVDGQRHTRTLSKEDVQTFFALDKESKKSFAADLAKKYLTPKQNQEQQSEIYDIRAIQYGYEVKFQREISALNWKEMAEMAEDYAGALKPQAGDVIFYFSEIDDAKAFISDVIKTNGDRRVKASLNSGLVFHEQELSDFKSVLDKHLPEWGGYIPFENHFTFEDMYFKMQEAIGIASDEKYGYAVVLKDNSKVPYQTLKSQTELMNHLVHETLLASAVGKGDEVSFVDGYTVPSKKAPDFKDKIDIVKFDEEGKLNIIGSRIILKNGEAQTENFDHGKDMSLEGIKELYAGIKEMRDLERQEEEEISEEVDEEEDVHRGFHR